MDVREGISVIRCGHIQLPIIPARTPSTISFRDNVKRGCPGRIRWPNDPHLSHLPELFAGDIKFVPEEAACPGENGGARSGHGVENPMLWSRRIIHWGRGHRGEVCEERGDGLGLRGDGDVEGR